MCIINRLLSINTNHDKWALFWSSIITVPEMLKISSSIMFNVFEMFWLISIIWIILYSCWMNFKQSVFVSYLLRGLLCYVYVPHVWLNSAKHHSIFICSINRYGKVLERLWILCGNLNWTLNNLLTTLRLRNSTIYSVWIKNSTSHAAWLEIRWFSIVVGGGGIGANHSLNFVPLSSPIPKEINQML